MQEQGYEFNSFYYLALKMYSYALPYDIGDGQRNFSPLYCILIIVSEYGHREGLLQYSPNILFQIRRRIYFITEELICGS